MNEKGVSMYVSHITGLALTLLAFGLITAGALSYYTGVSEKSQEAQALIVVQSIADTIVELEAVYRDTVAAPALNGSNITLAEIVMDVPPKISGKNYEIILEPREDFWIVNNLTVGGVRDDVLSEDRPYSRITIRTDGRPNIEFTHYIYNILVKTTGSAEDTDRIKLSYIRERTSRTTTQDKVILTNA